MRHIVTSNLFRTLVVLFFLTPTALAYAGADDGWLFALDSGIILLGEPGATIVPLGDSPPPDSYTISTFSFTIRNKNDICDEDVRIQQADFLNDILPGDTSERRQGYSALLGFKRELSDSPVESLSFGLADQSEATIYVDVATGEDEDGCDFRGFSLGVGICDTGPRCFFCCDWEKRPSCEPPTRYIPRIHIIAAEIPPPAPLARIHGTVNNSRGRPVAARIFINSEGPCVPGGVDVSRAGAAFEGTQRDVVMGVYDVNELPYGKYSVTATKDGESQVESGVVLNAATPEAVVNFTF